MLLFKTGWQESVEKDYYRIYYISIFLSLISISKFYFPLFLFTFFQFYTQFLNFLLKCLPFFKFNFHLFCILFLIFLFFYMEMLHFISFCFPSGFIPVGTNFTCLLWFIVYCWYCWLAIFGPLSFMHQSCIISISWLIKLLSVLELTMIHPGKCFMI